MFTFISHAEKKTGNHLLVSIKSSENTTLCWNSSMVMMKNLWPGLKAKPPKKPNSTISALGKLRLNSRRLPALYFLHMYFSFFSPFPEPKRKYNMSYDGTEKEPAKRIKIKRSLVIFPFCRLLIVFC